MKITFKNLGPLHECSITLADLTIVTGHNNTGKTYATYGVFGLLSGWKHWLDLPQFKAVTQELIANGKYKLDLNQFTGSAFRGHMTRLAHIYQINLPRVLAGERDRFKDTKVHLDFGDCPELDTIEINLQQLLPSGDRLSIKKVPGEDFAHITHNPSLTGGSGGGLPPSYLIEKWLSETFIDIVFQPCFPRVYIASTERTGAAIFQRELQLGRNRIIEMLADLKPGESVDPWALMQKMSSSYAYPVQQNVDFLNPANLEPLQRQNGVIASQRPDIIDALEQVTGGTYKVNKDGAYFLPSKQRGLKLRLGESSSAARSLLDVTYYTKHVLRPGDCFIIDEPELNLHPRNQRKFARIVGRLVNAGVKVFLTTHSDYVIRELNTLILLSGRKITQKELLKELQYDPLELISAKQVRCYKTAEDLCDVEDGQRRRRLPLLKEVPVTEFTGIEVSSFDEEIEELNRIQDAIIYTSEPKTSSTNE